MTIRLDLSTITRRFSSDEVPTSSPRIETKIRGIITGRAGIQTDSPTFYSPLAPSPLSTPISLETSPRSAVEYITIPEQLRFHWIIERLEPSMTDADVVSCLEAGDFFAEITQASIPDEKTYADVALKIYTLFPQFFVSAPFFNRINFTALASASSDATAFIYRTFAEQIDYLVDTIPLGIYSTQQQLFLELLAKGSVSKSAITRFFDRVALELDNPAMQDRIYYYCFQQGGLLQEVLFEKFNRDGVPATVEPLLRSIASAPSDKDRVLELLKSSIIPIKRGTLPRCIEAMELLEHTIPASTFSKFILDNLDFLMEKSVSNPLQQYRWADFAITHGKDIGASITTLRNAALYLLQAALRMDSLEYISAISR